MGDGGLTPISETSFGAEGIYEREDIQRLLRDNIAVLGEPLFVIAEEFGEWLDSLRRIDLLCLDCDANLVVVELKRTEDGGHMELQALRYAAMISAMTFQQLVETHARSRNPNHPDTDSAKAAILDFLEWDEVDEDQFGRDTRIVLASADFGKELTTTALWLIERGLDIKCVRLKPYRLPTGQVLLDIQQLIPLPETASFQTQIGVKRQAARQNRTDRHDLSAQWWTALLEQPGSDLHHKVSPLPSPYFRVQTAPRTRFVYCVWENECAVEFFAENGDEADRASRFDLWLKHKEAIERAFGAALDWETPGRKACRVRYCMQGGYRSGEAEWVEILGKQIDAMNRLYAAINPMLKSIGIGA